MFNRHLLVVAGLALVAGSASGGLPVLTARSRYVLQIVVFVCSAVAAGVAVAECALMIR